MEEERKEERNERSFSNGIPYPAYYGSSQDDVRCRSNSTKFGTQYVAVAPGDVRVCISDGVTVFQDNVSLNKYVRRDFLQTYYKL